MSSDETGIDALAVVPLSADEVADSIPCGSGADIALRLKAVRDVFDFSQRELAKRAGVTNSSISMIEQGQVSPSILSLSRILAVFPMSLADFFSFKLSVSSHTSSQDCINKQVIANSALQDPHQLEAGTECLSAGQFTAFASATTDCCGVILDGSVNLTLLIGNRRLNQGDSFYIPAHQPFRFINLSAQDASFFRCSLFVRER